jgi:predicted neuraminidase
MSHGIWNPLSSYPYLYYDFQLASHGYQTYHHDVYEQPLLEWRDTWHAIQNSQMPSMLGSVAMIAITNKKIAQSRSGIRYAGEDRPLTTRPE